MPQPGDLIAGKYRLETQLGRGGMGAVYAARHTTTGRRFAIKLLSHELAGDAQAEARFLREATLASAINHPAIVEVYDVGHHEGFPYMVMKLLQGETLGQRLRRGTLSPQEAIAILVPVLDGIGAAHDNGIVHRDLKPDNIMLEREGGIERPRVLDFGISKLVGGTDNRTGLTRPGTSIGTPDYMSPEQVRGVADLDGRTDVYALGVILYEMLTGAVPYEGNNYADLVLKIVNGGAPGIRAWNTELSEELEAIVARAMAASREQRFASVKELSDALVHFKRSRPSTVGPRATRPRPSSGSTPFATEANAPVVVPVRSPRLGYALGAVAGLLATSGLLWLFWPESSAAPPVKAAASAPARPPPAPAPKPKVAKLEVAPQPQPQPPAAQPTLAAEPVAPTPGWNDPATPTTPPSAEPPKPAVESARSRARAERRSANTRDEAARRRMDQPDMGADIIDPFAAPR
jgi:serine/threonine-protein kinase